MRPITLQNLTAFLCITGSLFGIGSATVKGKEPPSRFAQPFIRRSQVPHWSGEPADELEAKIQLHMRPNTWELE